MAVNYRLWEKAKIVELLAPAADAAGRTSGYVSLTNALKAYIVCHITQGNAATVLLTPLQATDASATGSKAISVTSIVSDLDCAAADTLVVRTNAANYTTDAGVKHKLVIFEIDPAQCLDLAGGFNHIAVSTGASNAANITQAMLYLTPIRDNMQTPPTTTSV